MSKTSAKQRYTQLMEWLEVRKTTTNQTPGSKQKSTTKFSKADLYNKSRR